MADQFSFHEDQREQMAELLADENNSLWSQVLYGITGGDGEIVTVALSQVGNTGGWVHNDNNKSIVVGLSNICYTPINKFPQNSLW